MSERLAYRFVTFWLGSAGFTDSFGGAEGIGAGESRGVSWGVSLRMGAMVQAIASRRVGEDGGPRMEGCRWKYAGSLARLVDLTLAAAAKTREGGGIGMDRAWILWW